jgi:hypothetical protein
MGDPGLPDPIYRFIVYSIGDPGLMNSEYRFLKRDTAVAGVPHLLRHVFRDDLGSALNTLFLGIVLRHV